MIGTDHINSWFDALLDNANGEEVHVGRTRGAMTALHWGLWLYVSEPFALLQVFRLAVHDGLNMFNSY